MWVHGLAFESINASMLCIYQGGNGFSVIFMVSCTFEILVLCGLKEQPFFSLASGQWGWQVLFAL